MLFLGIVYQFKYKFMATIRIATIVKNPTFLKLQMTVTEKIFDQRPKKNMMGVINTM